MKQDKLTIKEMLADLISEAHAAISAGEEVVYEEAIGNLVNFHITLIKAGMFINPQGQVDNYALIPAGSSLFNLEVHQEWTRYYHNLFSVVTSELSRNKSYFERISYIPGSLFSGMYEVKSPKILTNIIQLQSVLYYYLESWWARTVEEQGKLEHNICSPILLNPPFYSIYESALTVFVSTWESLKNYYFIPQSTAGNPGWDDLRVLLPFYETHLSESAINLFRSVSKGDWEGALWLLDVLMKWQSGHQYRFSESYNLLRHAKMFTIEQLAEDWDVVKKSIDIDSAGVRTFEAPKEIFSICLKNLWIDINSITIYTLIKWGIECNCEKSLPANLVNLLLHGTPVKHGSEGLAKYKLFQNATDVLIMILRQHYANSLYRSRLDGTVERIAGLRKTSMVSSRIYSSWGRDDLNSVIDGQLLLLCILAKASWNPINQLERIIRLLAAINDDALRSMQEDMKKWVIRLSSPEFSYYKEFYLCVIKKDEQNDNFEASIETVKDTFANLISFVKDLHQEQLSQAVVSPNRLADVAKWASSRGFSRDSGSVPLTLFNNVTYSRVVFATRSLIIKEMNKGEFTDPLKAQMPINQDEWFAKTVEDYVNAHIMADIIQKSKPFAVDTSTAISYWVQMKKVASKIREAGFTPILLVENPSIPDWIWDWTTAEEYEKTKRPDDMQLSRDEAYKQINNYLGNFNGIAVFYAPLSLGASYLLGKEALEEVKFTEFDDNVYVGVTFEEHVDKKGLIDLKLSWAFQLEMRECPAFKLEYSRIKD